MPCGYPKDPAATKAKRQATAAAKRAEALRIKESDDTLAQLRAKLTGEEAPADVLKRVFNRQQAEVAEAEDEDISWHLRQLEARVEELESDLNYANDSVAEDGDHSPHVQFGEVIRVNGVRFQLVNFEQGIGGAIVTFVEESALQQENQDMENHSKYRRVHGRPRFVDYNYKQRGDVR